jgi:hypothetical protein
MSWTCRRCGAELPPELARELGGRAEVLWRCLAPGRPPDPWWWTAGQLWHQCPDLVPLGNVWTPAKGLCVDLDCATIGAGR